MIIIIILFTNSTFWVLNRKKSWITSYAVFSYAWFKKCMHMSKWKNPNWHLIFASLTDPLKKALTVEIKAWKKLLCKYLKEEYKKKVISTSIHTNKYFIQLSHPVTNLEDVHRAVNALSKLRDSEIQTDMTLISIEVCTKQ